MKRIQRTAALLLALLMLMAALSAPALAASYKVATLKTGKWYKAASYEPKTIYKLKLTADSIVTVSWKGNKNDEASISFYNSKACKNRVYSPELYDSVSGSETVALLKGTYYVQMYEYEDKPTTQAKITVQRAVNKTNYCRAKAITLKSGQTVKIAQTADNCYSRWYKITLPKKMTVTITTNKGHTEDIQFLDSKMREVDCASGKKLILTEDKIAKGTYFICVTSPRDIDEYVGTYISLKWK